MTTATLSDKPSHNWGRLARFAFIGTLATAVVNALAYFLLNALGWMPAEVVFPDQPPVAFSVAPVVTVTIMAGVVAALLFAALVAFTRQPARIFTIIAVVVFLVMEAPALMMGFSAPVIVGLNILHIIAAVGITLSLTRSVSASAR